MHMLATFSTLRFSRAGLLAGLLSLSLLGACGGNDDEDGSSAYDGTVTWTHNGQSYTSKAYASAIVDSPTKFIITAAPDGNNTQTVSLVIYNLDTRGAANYDLARGSSLSDLPIGALTLSGGSGPNGIYSTLYGPAASNGTLSVTQYDKAAQKISGTFSFTAGPTANTGAVGTQTVSNGSFSFTKFR
ncbi:hypothetical protein EJV47_23555 [Hymenobacter gummosus]|uniref:Lipoprotein n=1 Tax=Hymenobacter gummosus TaxID=1776032 RepID=A0A3S0J6C9_9BACT|nr:DUF6252 family protein [Hymenobacter gummosus]RTQ45813.1 hypothetical protein EJV47_23555 [Hymenobacter gummosus]